LSRFLISVAVLGALLIVAARFWRPAPSWDVAIVAFLAVTTAGIYMLLYPRRADPEKFTQLYLLSIVVKLLLSAAFAVVFLLNAEDPSVNTVFFLIAYLLFTGLEVVFLLVKSNPKKNS
jgi:hypothetical protein